MKIDANDPKWTAYALGEITDENERAEIESILEESTEARRLVEEIRQTAGFLKEELQAEASVHLTEEQRNRIEVKATVRRSWFGLRPAWAMAGAAAILVLISIVTFRQLKQTEQTPDGHQPFISTKYDQSSLKPPGKIKRQISKNTIASSTEVKEQLPPAKQPTKEISPKKVEKAVMAKAVAPPRLPTETLSSTLSSAPAAAQQAQLPSKKNASDLVKVMSGVVTADDTIFNADTSSFAGVGVNKANLQRNGVTVNDVRYPHMKPPHWPRKGERPWPPLRKQDGEFNTEAYDHISDNPFLDVAQNPLSTFSIDVDTASYSNVRRYLGNGSLPPKDAVRIEELINYFDYDYEGPKDNKPFAVNFELTEAPWNPEHRLLRIGIKGREIKPDKRPNSNLVFLLDVSGSMDTENKLPLVKKSMHLLVDQLTESDRVAIVVYAGASGVALPSTSGDQKEKIRYAIDRMHAGGSTNGASGIILAYQTAKENFFRGGVNRVILATDGDFNVGITNQGDLTRLIEEKAKSGIFLSALGFGMGNYKDSTLETLANKGRGNYAYIDNINEAKKVFVEQINSTLVTIAKDVKIQVEFNPGLVSSYRLIGYENRIMAKEDFNDDTKMAGAIGAGHAVTALYELVPAGVKTSKPDVDPLKYQKPSQPSSSADSNEVVTVKIRSKEPEKDTSVQSEFVVKESKNRFRDASQDFKFAAAVAAFGMALRDSPYKGSANLERALEWAKEGKGIDKHGYRQEFIRLIHRAISISF